MLKTRLAFRRVNTGRVERRTVCSFSLSFFQLPVCLFTGLSALQYGGPIHPLCDNANLFIFCGWSKNLEWTSSRSKAPSKRCLFSIPPPSKDCSLPLGLGRERL